MPGRPMGSGLAGNLQEAVERRSWPTLSHPCLGRPGARTPLIRSQSSCPDPLLKGVVGRVNPTLPWLSGALLTTVRR